MFFTCLHNVLSAEPQRNKVAGLLRGDVNKSNITGRVNVRGNPVCACISCVMLLALIHSSLAKKIMFNFKL